MGSSSSVSPLAYIKLVMLGFGSIFGLFLGGRELLVTLSEPEPTRITAAEMPEHYRGQRWLAVRGRVAVEHRALEPSTHRTHAGRDLYYLYVPVVPERWEATQPVSVLATFGPFSHAEAEAWRPPETVVQGTLRTGVLDPVRERFPALHLTDELVVLNAGSTPTSLGGALFFFALMLFGALVAWSIVLPDLRRWWRARSRP
ncbi:MAG: hypothetical protein AAGE52_41170 [Myxococcota bacterium]